MSLDYYLCDKCGKKFSEISWDADWCECGGRFCSKKCADKIDDFCCKCRKEVVRDEELLDFLLKRGNLTREQAVELYRNGK